MKHLILLLAFGAPVCTSAQTTERLLDASLRPASTGKAIYRERTRQQGDHWYVETWYIKENRLAEIRNCTDPECRRRVGAQVSYYPGGQVYDSTIFDGNGNARRTVWFENGNKHSEGNLVRDTANDGTWKFYYENGQPLAEALFQNNQEVSARCWDERGRERAAADCKGREADFPGGVQGWITYLQGNLTAPKKAPAGTYTVRMQFVVDKDGRLYDFKPLTALGYGFEQEVERLLRKSPRWVPALQFGRPVKAYRTQPVTFVISE